MNDSKYIGLRNKLVAELKSKGISDKKVLGAIGVVPRHLFLDPVFRDKFAYEDSAFPIGEGQTISQPYTVAFQTELLNISKGSKVLEIGTGSGYQAAVLSPLVKHVYTIEIVKSLANNADNRLKILGYKNITIRWGDGYKGWPEEAPFDRIIVTAAPPEIPQALIEQLGIGGKMVIPVGTRLQEIVVVEKSESGEISKKKVLPVRFVPMIRGK